ncbi:MAG TPA: DUF3006 family protein [Gemmatimonadaceae bacterium]
MPSEAHRWVIDSIAEHVAAIQVDGSAMVRLPQWVLPRGAAEGQVLSVTHELDGKGERSTLTIAIDRAGTATALRESKAQVDAMRKASSRRDTGGDIKL